MKNNETCLPTDALSIDGTPPSPGDTIEVNSLKGTVTRVEGGNTYFTPTEINGQPVDEGAGDDTAGEPAEGEGTGDGAPSGDTLRAAAQAMDTQGGY